MNAHVPDPSKMTDFRRMDCNQLTATHIKIHTDFDCDSLTAVKCPSPTDSPIAKGAEPVTSVLRLSVTAMIHRTS